jgi:hypothetical protein
MECDDVVVVAFEQTAGVRADRRAAEGLPQSLPDGRRRSRTHCGRRQPQGGPGGRNRVGGRIGADRALGCLPSSRIRSTGWPSRIPGSHFGAYSQRARRPFAGRHQSDGQVEPTQLLPVREFARRNFCDVLKARRPDRVARVNHERCTNFGDFKGFQSFKCETRSTLTQYLHLAAGCFWRRAQPVSATLYSSSKDGVWT